MFSLPFQNISKSVVLCDELNISSQQQMNLIGIEA